MNRYTDTQHIHGITISWGREEQLEKSLKKFLSGVRTTTKKRLRGTTPQENNCRLLNKDPQYQVHPGEDSSESLGLQGDQTSPS